MFKPNHFKSKPKTKNKRTSLQTRGSIKNKRTRISVSRKTKSIDFKKNYIDKKITSVLGKGKVNYRGKKDNAFNHNNQISNFNNNVNYSNYTSSISKKIRVPKLLPKNVTSLRRKSNRTNSLDTLSFPSQPKQPSLPFLRRQPTVTDLHRFSVQTTNSRQKLTRNISHANAIPTKKGPLMSTAKSAGFGLNGLSAVYAVNTTNGLIRNYNEDRVSIVVNIKKKSGWTGRWPVCSYFAVFDGHGGSLCADYLKENLHTQILDHPHFPTDVPKALKEGCRVIEREFCAFALKQTNVDRSGACALITIIVDNVVYVGNVGDSRAFVVERGGKVIRPLSRDHKPEDPQEYERVVTNGGQVSKSNLFYNCKMPAEVKERLRGLPFRVYPGGLSVSRSFGDVTAKNEDYGGNPLVLVATPEIRSYNIDPLYTDFLFMGCRLNR